MRPALVREMVDAGVPTYCESRYDLTQTNYTQVRLRPPGHAPTANALTSALPFWCDLGCILNAVAGYAQVSLQMCSLKWRYVFLPFRRYGHGNGYAYVGMCWCTWRPNSMKGWAGVVYRGAW